MPLTYHRFLKSILFMVSPPRPHHTHSQIKIRTAVLISFGLGLVPSIQYSVCSSQPLNAFSFANVRIGAGGALSPGKQGQKLVSPNSPDQTQCKLHACRRIPQRPFGWGSILSCAQRVPPLHSHPSAQHDSTDHPASEGTTRAAAVPLLLRAPNPPSRRKREQWKLPEHCGCTRPCAEDSHPLWPLILMPNG